MKATKLKSKLRAAKRSMTVWFSAAIPVALAAAETLKENLPFLSEVLTGWNMVLASVAVSVVVAYLRVRNTEGE